MCKFVSGLNLDFWISFKLSLILQHIWTQKCFKILKNFKTQNPVAKWLKFKISIFLIPFIIKFHHIDYNSLPLENLINNCYFLWFTIDQIFKIIKILLNNKKKSFQYSVKQCRPGRFGKILNLKQSIKIEMRTKKFIDNLDHHHHSLKCKISIHV